MEEKYSFETPGLFKNIDPEKAAQEMKRIREKYGLLKPEYVVKEASKKRSLFHNYFEWDDTLAAQNWRNEQARILIKNLKVEIVHQEISAKVRAFVCVREQEDSPRTYVPIRDAVLNPTAYQDLLDKSKRDMETFISTYSQITELNNVKVEMLKVLNS